MDGVFADTASFRDPAGRVYHAGDRVFRTVMPCAAEDFDYVRSTGFVDAQIETGNLISAQMVDRGVLGDRAEGARYVVEHPRLPFVSYPYEWPFALLKAAALLHLDLHIDALGHNITLSDASAYNIQFFGVRPVFIDTLSFRRYRDGEFWLGHRQFCEQFLNPLLLWSLTGVPHNAWYRGTQEGISAEDLRRVLPLRRKFGWNVLTHVVMQAGLQSAAGTPEKARDAVRNRRLPKEAFRRMLVGLRRWIDRLEPSERDKSIWSRYDEDNSYSSDEARAKREFVSSFVAHTRPRILWDIGCNTGAYARAAIRSGADLVVGFDSDHRALNLAVDRARSDNLRFLPLYLDAANPTPSQGWAQRERCGLLERAEADGLLALALVHHLAIGRNIPIRALVGWLVELAPRGVVEFVPKKDPMVQRLFDLREDVFDDYDESSFLDALRSRAEIVGETTVSATGRRLFRYLRR